MAVNGIRRAAACTVLLFLLLPAWGRAGESFQPWQFYCRMELNSFIRDADQGSRTLDFGFEKVKLGAKYKDGRLKARFEYGLDGELRRLWGRWKFGKIRILVGQEYTPVYMDYSLDDFGGLSAGRRPMIQLQYKGLKIAAVEPRLKKLGVPGASKEATLPKMEISYNHRNGPFGLEAAAGLNRYKLGSPGGNPEINAWVLGLGMDMAWGPLFLGGSIHTGRNPGPYGLNSITNGNPAVRGSNVHDNRTVGYALLARYIFRNDLSLETGWGERRNRVDGAPGRDRARSLYILLQYIPFQGLRIRPEVGIQDYEPGLTGLAESRTLYYGIKWETDF